MTLTPEDLRALVIYDPESGSLVWAQRKQEDFVSTPARSAERQSKAFNTKHAGTLALASRAWKGHLGGRVRGVPILAHRAAWAIHYGEWPKGQIDHINGDPADNRIVNLRDVSALENARNAKLRKDNKTGVPGVYPSRSGKWWVYVSSRYLGTFDTLQDALKARGAAEEANNYHENHGRIDAAMEALASLKARCIAIRKARAA